MIAAGILSAWLTAAPCAPPAMAAHPDAQTLAGLTQRFGPFGVDGVRLDGAWLTRSIEARCALRAAPPVFLQPRSHPGPTIQSVLARPLFRNARPGGNELGARLERWFQWLLSLLESRGAGQYADITRVLVLGFAALVGGYGLYRITRRRYPKEPRPPARPPVGGLELEHPESHLLRARELLGRAPREALREALLALLALLEGKRWARPDRVKTNRELSGELESRGAPAEISAQVRPMLREFDRAYYSLEPVAVSDAEAFLAAVRSLQGRMEAER